jgi:N-acetylmuramoyl-L-alanine amidase
VTPCPPANERLCSGVPRTRIGAWLGSLLACAVTVSGQWVAPAAAGAAAARHAAHPPRAGARRSSAATSNHGRSVSLRGVPVSKKRFEPNSCVAFSPTTGKAAHTVFLDAGHGSIDPGGQGTTSTGQTIYEAPSNLAIEMDVMRLLTGKGFRVVVSRTTATEVVRLTTTDRTGGILSVEGARADVAARDECANLAHATLLVGIYLDAGTTSQDAGCLTAYDAARPFSAQSERFASLLQNDVLARLNAHGWQIPNDGVQPDTTLGGLPLTTTAASYHHLLLLGPALPGWFATPSQMPGALIEPLFISDPFEGTIAVSSAGRSAIARGTAEAIEQYFSPAYKPSKLVGP